MHNFHEYRLYVNCLFGITLCIISRLLMVVNKGVCAYFRMTLLIIFFAREWQIYFSEAKQTPKILLLNIVLLNAWKLVNVFCLYQ